MRRLSRIAVAALAALFATVGLTAGPAGAAASDESVVIGMPFDGRWANRFGTTPDVHNARGDWAMDIFATGAPVTASFADPSGELSLTVSDVSDASCSPYAGDRVVLDVAVDGAFIGTVSYMHLVDVAVAEGQAIAPGALLGRTPKAAENFLSGGCWRVSFPRTGIHVHFEVTNAIGYSCYVGYDIEERLATGTPIGVLGASDAAARRSRCPGVPASPSPPSIAVSTGYAADQHPDLLVASGRLDLTPEEIQSFGVSAIRFINGITGVDDPEDIDPIPVDGPFTHVSEWPAAGAERDALTWVTTGYGIDEAQAQKFGATLITFLSGIEPT